MNRWHYESRSHVRENVNAIALETIKRIMWDQPATPIETKAHWIDGVLQLVFRIEESIKTEENNDANP